jgi:hypothetical protein
MLAHHLEWHLRARLAPMLYDDHDRAAAEALRASPVPKAPRAIKPLVCASPALTGWERKNK